MAHHFLPALLLVLAGCSIENEIQQLAELEESVTVELALPPRPDSDPAELQACTTAAALIGTVAFETLGDAVRSAAPGEEVLVCPGTHDDALLLTRDIRLRAADRDREATELLRTLEIDGAHDVELLGLTFRGETSILNSPLAGHASVLVLDSWLLSPPGAEGHIWGGIITSGPMTLGRVWMEGLGIGVVRQGPYDGSDNPDVRILDSVFFDNHGGIQLDGPGTLTLTDVVFDETGGCGAITVAMGAMSHLPSDPTTIVAENVEFVRTRSEPSIYPVAGAVLLREVDTLRCTQCTWLDNLDHDVASDIGAIDDPGSTFVF